MRRKQRKTRAWTPSLYLSTSLFLSLSLSPSLSFSLSLSPSLSFSLSLSPTATHRPVQQGVLNLVRRQAVAPVSQSPRGALDAAGLEVGDPPCHGEPGVEDVADAFDEGLGLVGKGARPVDHVAFDYFFF